MSFLFIELKIIKMFSELSFHKFNTNRNTLTELIYIQQKTNLIIGLLYYKQKLHNLNTKLYKINNLKLKLFFCSKVGTI